MILAVKSGERVSLRELERGHVDDLHRLYTDPVVTFNLSFDSRTLVEVGSLITRMAEAARAKPRTEYLLAAHLADGTFIGVARLALDTDPVDLEEATATPHSAQLGGALSAAHWGHGYGTEVANILMDLGFNDLGLHRLWGARGPENEASRKLMEAIGMNEESRLRDHVFTNGAWRDSVVHSILRDEYLDPNRARR
jgi:RimJ/RimL family protein N-acetyltransferase